MGNKNKFQAFHNTQYNNVATTSDYISLVIYCDFNKKLLALISSLLQFS